LQPPILVVVELLLLLLMDHLPIMATPIAMVLLG
jgi:hypothetical protein